MRQHIEFDVNALIDELNVLEKVQLPYAANRALRDFGYYAKRFLGAEMQKTFDRPVPFTTRSPYYRMGNLEVQIGINDSAVKGTPPAAYLLPQIRESGTARKEVKVQRFSGALQRRGITYGVAVPNDRSRAAQLLGLNSYGNLRPSAYTRVLGALNALEAAGPTRGRDKFFVIPTEKPGGQLAPGVYHRKEASISQLMALADTPPAVSPHFDFYGLVREEAEDQLPSMLMRRLREAVL